jgi:hypothetical protein
MARTLTTATENALAASQVRALMFVLMDFPSGYLRVNNSAITFTWDGASWLGVGNLGSIDAVSEGIGLDARGLAFRISGVPAANIAIALGQQYQGRDCKVWLAPLSEAHAIIADPVLVFHGRMDVMDIELGETATITVTAESRLADWDRPRIRRFNHEDQQIDWPADKGFEFVPQMAEKELRWGY